MAIQCLPGSVGWIVVTEALGRARSAHHELAGVAGDQAFDLEWLAVAESFRIVEGLAPERAQRDDLDRLAEQACQILVEARGVEGEAHHPRPRTVRTGQGAIAVTRAATLPTKNRATPVRPWVPMMIMSAPCRLAARTICSCATPSSSRPRARTRAVLALASR